MLVITPSNITIVYLQALGAMLAYNEVMLGEVVSEDDIKDIALIVVTTQLSQIWTYKDVHMSNVIMLNNYLSAKERLLKLVNDNNAMIQVIKEATETLAQINKDNKDLKGEI